MKLEGPSVSKVKHFARTWARIGSRGSVGTANAITSQTSSWCHWQGRRFTQLGRVSVGASIALGLTLFYYFHIVHSVSLLGLVYSTITFH